MAVFLIRTDWSLGTSEISCFHFYINKSGSNFLFCSASLSLCPSPQHGNSVFGSVGCSLAPMSTGFHTSLLPLSVAEFDLLEVLAVQKQHPMCQLRPEGRRPLLVVLWKVFLLICFSVRLSAALIPFSSAIYPSVETSGIFPKHLLGLTEFSQFFQED